MSDAWVEIRNCNWLHEAHFVESVLESEGIEVQVPDEHTLGIQPDERGCDWRGACDGACVRSRAREGAPRIGDGVAAGRFSRW